MISATVNYLGKIISSFIYIFKSIVMSVRSLLFAYYYPKIAGKFYNSEIAPFKREVFGDIDTVIPSEPNKQNGCVKILEIGVGPGFNLDYLPTKCRYVALDKNSYFKKVLLKNLQKHPGIILEKFINECGENMKSVPSNSIDVVISSSTHCSVDNSKEVLKEVNRVLVPGGRYYFFEHVIDEPTTFRSRLQKFVNKTGLWQFCFHGCTFINFEEIISKADFVKYKGKRYAFNMNSWTYYPGYLVASHFGGYAVKAK